MDDSSGKRSASILSHSPALFLALSTLIDRQTNGKRNAIPEICILLIPTEQRTDEQIPSILSRKRKKEGEEEEGRDMYLVCEQFFDSHCSCN